MMTDDEREKAGALHSIEIWSEGAPDLPGSKLLGIIPFPEDAFKPAEVEAVPKEDGVAKGTATWRRIGRKDETNL